MGLKKLRSMLVSHSSRITQIENFIDKPYRYFHSLHKILFGERSAKLDPNRTVTKMTKTVKG